MRTTGDKEGGEGTRAKYARAKARAALSFRHFSLAEVAPAHPCARDIRASLHSTKKSDPGCRGGAPAISF
jgi:hypothetical protein